MPPEQHSDHRPRVSNDNPSSEAQFKTLKHRPDFPGRDGDTAANTAGRRSSRLGPGALPYLLALPIVLYESLFIVYPIFQGLAATFQNITLGAKPAV